MRGDHIDMGSIHSDASHSPNLGGGNVDSPTQRRDRLHKFVTWFQNHCTGREKREGQIFFDRLLQAFGNAGVLEAGATCEDPVRKKSGRIGFADLVWRPRVVIELKERGTDLRKHYPQAEEYWLGLVPNRPKYMALCNFDEFWIFDLNLQLNDPVHTLKTETLGDEWGALAFLFPSPEVPVFNLNNVEVTEKAARTVGEIFSSMVARGIAQEQAQRLVLQCVVALFAEDTGLLPKYIFQRILQSAIDDMNALQISTKLFKAMAEEDKKKKPKEFSEIPYFNGGLFKIVDNLELNFQELDLLYEASKYQWSRIRPSIFGAIFESTMDPEKRHNQGAHYTSELDIQKIVTPTIIRPLREEILAAKTKKQLVAILQRIQNFRVLDPACGSGNFLYVAFRELRRLEREILDLVDNKTDPAQRRMSLVSPRNFFGIDSNKFGIELAKIALSFGRKLSAQEFGLADNAIPFDNLDSNFLHDDALFCDWPKADAIVGNPPYQSKNKIQQELGVTYVNKVRDAYPDVPGHADYCVYWFRKAHDHLSVGGRAGLVGTNTVRQNFSREASLDYITHNGGTITEAVATQVWSGDAVVHVSLVNWVKGVYAGKKKLYKQIGNSIESPWEVTEVEVINPALSREIDLTGASKLTTNVSAERCYQGQTHGHEGFILSADEFEQLAGRDAPNNEVIFPYLTGDELLSLNPPRPGRYIIDLQPRNLIEAQRFPEVFSRLQKTVLPTRTAAAAEEEERNEEARKVNKKAKINHHHKNFLARWWLLSYPREDLISKLAAIDRYIVCARVTKRPIFEFVRNSVHPSDALQVFVFDDDYSFGVLQSIFHTSWFDEKCSTMKSDPRYTSTSVFDTFPWPQSPSHDSIRAVATAANNLRQLRQRLMSSSNLSLREIYRTLEMPGQNPLRDAHNALDAAVAGAYGCEDLDNRLSFLLLLNATCKNAEENGQPTRGPGLLPGEHQLGKISADGIDLNND